MILLIDNYDSFSFNLYQFLGEWEPDILVVRNDEMTLEEIRAKQPDKIVLSPGPGRPEDAGNIIDVVKTLGKDIPILGVCLGHQAICSAFGASIDYAGQLMHGKQSEISRGSNLSSVSWLQKQKSCGKIPLSRRSTPYSSRFPESNCHYHQRGNYGCAAHGISHFRRTVPSRICHDTRRKNHD